MNKEELRQYSAKLLGEKEELQERIDKAIEYIEKHIAIFKGGDMLVDMNINELLKILDKGE